MNNNKLIKLINARFRVNFDEDILDQEGNEMQKGQITIFIGMLMQEEVLDAKADLLI